MTEVQLSVYPSIYCQNLARKDTQEMLAVHQETGGALLGSTGRLIRGSITELAAPLYM